VRKFTIALVLALVVLMGVCLPISAASIESIPTLTYTPTACKFYLNGTYAGTSDIVNGVLADDVSMVCQSWGGKYKVEFQSGTSIALRPKGAKAMNFAIARVYISSGVVTFSANCSLSGKPVNVYKLVGEEWVRQTDIDFW
jgi:hypothetical protein